MPMPHDKKRSVTLILDRLKGMREAPKSENGGMEDNSIALEAAAQDMMKAMQVEDTGLLVQALKSFIEMCESSEDEEDSMEY